MLPNPPWTIAVPTRYLTADLAPGMFRFGADEDGAIAGAIGVNTLFEPVLLGYYERGWGKDR